MGRRPVRDHDGAHGAAVDDGFVMKAVFVEVVEPERIVFKELDGDMTTRVDVHRPRRRPHRGRHPSDELPAEYRHREAQAGFKTSLDKFAAYLATKVAGPTSRHGSSSARHRYQLATVR